ncbi:MAG: ABC transporter permease [Nitratireductor sp.]
MPNSQPLRIALWVIGPAVALFLIAPLLAIAPLSFNSSPYFTYPLEGLSTRWYEHFFGSLEWRRAVFNSFAVGISACVLATVLGTAAAFGVSDERMPGRNLVMAFLLSPMICPIIITAISVYFFYARVGLNSSFIGLVLAHALLGSPFVLITVNATLSNFDRRLPRAAASLGANGIVRFRRVTFPLIAPGVLAGGVLAFAISFDEVVVALFIAGVEQRTLPRQMWVGINQELNPTIAAAAVIMIIVSILLMVVVSMLRRFASDTIPGGGNVE